ncbi:MAG TPA: hypothetical protein PKN86_05890 [Candidatus Obscuribacter sp.]|nr:hypothetical protein [Candidatus Obscuribacter sp.]MBK9282605.1 hypothetical protein [Candidatus Obscuribacter sp.]MBL8085233.1 hypothetical protein [Candidatus Obscuribacter sp.]HMX44900.1 hypothetical protein [Candidatus Obscuribacter sp.]HMY52167.1 hypothetical protein [Candidatus Obscuribacter sp.]
MLQINEKASGFQVKIFAGEYAKALEGKINDWLSQQGAGLNPEIISIDVKEIGNGFYTAVVAYRRQPAQGQA